VWDEIVLVLTIACKLAFKNASDGWNIKMGAGFMEQKIVICDCDHKSIEIEEEVLKKHGYTCDWRRCMTEDEVIAGCADATVLLVQYAKVGRRAMEALPNLKQIVRYGVGVDTIDLEAARELGIEVCNVPDYGTFEVADQAMAHTLCLARKLYMTNADIRKGRWNYADAIPMHRLSVMTVGVIGLGRIGKAYAARMHAFGTKVIATDELAKDVPDYVTMVPFEELIKQSDIISIHCPADGNIGLIGEAEFAMMKDGAYLINVSRGGIIDEAALDAALTSGKLAGCGLDVAAKEPIPADHPLLRHPNLLVSPHIGWYSEESADELKRKVAEEALRFVTGEPVHYSVL